MLGAAAAGDGGAAGGPPLAARGAGWIRLAAVLATVAVMGWEGYAWLGWRFGVGLAQAFRQAASAPGWNVALEDGRVAGCEPPAGAPADSVSYLRCVFRVRDGAPPPAGYPRPGAVDTVAERWLGGCAAVGTPGTVPGVLRPSDAPADPAADRAALEGCAGAEGLP